MIITTAGPGTPRSQIAQTAAGVISETIPAAVGSAYTAPTTQTVFGSILGLRAGDVVTGIMMRNSTAAVGSLPTTARFGLATAAGVMVALSGNDNALALWAAGANAHPFTPGPYTVPADGGYFACFVVNGTWGSTQPTPKLFTATAAGDAAFGSAPPLQFNWSGQTDLPAISGSLTLSTQSTRTYYLAAY